MHAMQSSHTCAGGPAVSALLRSPLNNYDYEFLSKTQIDYSTGVCMRAGVMYVQAALAGAGTAHVCYTRSATPTLQRSIYITKVMINTLEPGYSGATVPRYSILCNVN